MQYTEQAIEKNFKYLQLLSERYPTIQSVCTEIINLRAILDLPKGTEHFMSDLHGEYEAFHHILNNCSGVVREKVEALFADRLTPEEQADLCTLIYYPELKLQQVKKISENTEDWYDRTLHRLIDVCRLTASKYTRSKVRKALPEDFAYIIDELLHADYAEENQLAYYSRIMDTIISLGDADNFIVALASLIKRLAVDRLHIVGDVFDRGPRPDKIIDMLMNHHSVDIQWGNHDILWMGAAAGSEACAAAAVGVSAAFNNLDVLEAGYGINLRPLALFAEKTYSPSPAFAPRILKGEQCGRQDIDQISKMRKAISIILFKLESQLIRRHPEYDMDNRLLLEKIDYDRAGILLDGRSYPLADNEFPTIDREDPSRLTGEEAEIVKHLQVSFASSARLARHVRFFYSAGSIYRIFNQNLMFHGCIPLDEAGQFAEVSVGGRIAGGRALMDASEAMARHAYFGRGDRRDALDYMWYLWCGKNSPLFGRSRMTTFERLYIEDRSTWTEEKNNYYRYALQRDVCESILEEFGLNRYISHIINGHVPVRAIEGENPVKAEGKLIVIDGGFSRAYQPTTGIAGYTLIYNSHGLRLSSHQPFESIQKAVGDNRDILSNSTVFETMPERVRVVDTDIGNQISEQIYELSLLLHAYRKNIIPPRP